MVKHNQLWRFILMKYNLKRKQAANLLGITVKEFDRKCNLNNWTEQDKQIFIYLGIDKRYFV